MADIIFSKGSGLNDSVYGKSQEPIRVMIDEIPPEERLNEIFAVNLRTVRGWTRELWAGVPNADSWENRIAVARRAMAETFPEWFDISPERITLTNSGLLFWNSVAEMIL